MKGDVDVTLYIYIIIAVSSSLIAAAAAAGITGLICYLKHKPPRRNGKLLLFCYVHKA